MHVPDYLGLDSKPIKLVTRFPLILVGFRVVVTGTVEQATRLVGTSLCSAC